MGQVWGAISREMQVVLRNGSNPGLEHLLDCSPLASISTETLFHSSIQNQRNFRGFDVTSGVRWRHSKGSLHDFLAAGIISLSLLVRILAFARVVEGWGS